jgi:formylglycine-generating enzyme required for sulfatase activity
LLLAISISFPQGSFAKGKLAVMDLKAKHGVRESLAEGLSVVVRDAIQGFGDYEVLSKDDVEVIAKRTTIRQSLGCDDTQCLIDIGRSLGTKFMVAGAISKFGDTYNVSLRLIDTMGKDAGVKKRINRSCECREDELINAVITVASLLMGKQASAQAPIASKAQDRPEKPFTNSTGMKFVLIPRGSFMMGSPPDEPKRGSEEKQHKVTIGKPFYLQTTEVTQGQWRSVMGENPSFFKDCGDGCAVENVSWYDAQQFIRRLNDMERTDHYRLPTEAEWEYACRAGTTTPFYTGNCISTDQANYNGNYPMWDCPIGIARKGTVRVGSFPPNPWGLYDMHGNVWEWCQDWHEVYPSGQVTDPKGPASGEYRVLRGGSYNYPAKGLRSASRGHNPPEHSILGNGGFRVAIGP